MKNRMQQWETRLNVAQVGHYASCEKYQNLNSFLGLPLVVLSSFVSAFLFFEQPNESISVFLKSAGLIVAILAPIQTFIRPAEKSEMHRIKATKYGGLKRKVESFDINESSADDNKIFIKAIIAEWNAIAEDSPVTPNNIRKQIKKIIDNDLHRMVGTKSSTD